MTRDLSRPSRRELLGAAAAATWMGGPLAGAASASGRNLLVVFAYGGWDTTYSIDPKLDSPWISGPEVDPPDPYEPDDVEDVATYGEIRVAVNPVKRPSVGAFFDRWARRAVVINGVEAGGIAHFPNRRRVLTGTGDPTRPDLLSIAGSRADASYPFGAVDLSGVSAPAALGSHVARLGYEWQLQGLIDPEVGGLGGGAPIDAARDARLAAYLERRTAELRAASDDPWLASYADGSARRAALEPRRRELAALIAGHSAARHQLSGNLDLAVDLLAGEWCRAVMVDSQQNFDTHADNANQHGMQEVLFSGLDAMLARLEATGILERTLVVVLSEMTRSPAINRLHGKDHWPNLSYLLVGGGIAGERVLGATDPYGTPSPMDLATGEADAAGVACRYNNVAAGILSYLDVDAAEWLGSSVQPLGGLA